jgi:hypothetical protein
VTAHDTIFLGSHPLPAAAVLVRLNPALVPALEVGDGQFVVGHDPGCDRVIDHPAVSGQHARLDRSGDRILIQDLGSSQGTFVNGQRIDRATAVRAGDLIGLGTYSFLISESRGAVSSGKEPPAARWAASPAQYPAEAASVAGHPPSPLRAGFLLELLRNVGSPWRMAASLAQAPLVALLIIVILSPSGGPALTFEAGTTAVAAALFWLGLAAVWFGLSNALLWASPGADPPGDRPGPGGTARLAVRLIVLGVLSLVQCVLAWGVVAKGAGLLGPALPTLSVLAFASAVGLALGMVIVSSAPRPAYAWAALPLVMLPLWLLGGEQRPLSRMASWDMAASNVVPSRWAFEGLLLLESDRRPELAGRESFRAGGGRAQAVSPAGSAPSRDLAEAYFSAETDRMGVGADLTALGAMLVGLAALAVFIARAPRPVA